MPATKRAPRRQEGHSILCGGDGLVLQVAESLVRLGEPLLVVCLSPARSTAHGLERLGVPIRREDHRDPAVLRDAGVDHAAALALLDEDDVGNLHLALIARDLNAGLRIVVRTFNAQLGERLDSLFTGCTFLSSSALAAPGFLAAIVSGNIGQRIVLAGRSLSVERASPDQENVVVPLARLQGEGGVEFFPRTGHDLLCLVASPAPAVAEPRRPRRRRRLPSAFSAIGRGFTIVVDWRMRVLLAFAALLVGVSTVIVHGVFAVTWLDSLYSVVTTLTTTGDGDISLRSAPGWVRLYYLVLRIVGALGIAVLFALVIDAIVGVRLARALGHRDIPAEDHVVVCGLGTVGYRIATSLAQRGTGVVAIERSPDNPLIAAARARGIHVLVADASHVDALSSVHAGTAKCLVAATDDDAANLMAGLGARSLKPGIRVVLRLFDHDLAARVESAFAIHIARSVAIQAAPYFVAALSGFPIDAIIPVGPRVVVAAALVVEEGSALASATVGGAEVYEARVLASEGNWLPPSDTRLAAGTTLTVVASRRGLADLTVATRGSRVPG